jgi:antitoxin component YwqK of YwqJK toxin-antitoxin module
MNGNRKYNLKNDQTKGWIYLYKNGKVIRDKPFHTRNVRRIWMKEFMEVCKIGTDDSYYIDIKLDM